MTKKTKEAIKTTAVIILVVLAVCMLWIYPLNQAGKIIVRPDDTDTLPPDLEKYGLAADSIAATTEDNIRLYGLYIYADSARGTAILIHGLPSGLNSQLPKAKALYERGWNVVLYDQRGFGKSEGKYRSGGYFEGFDLQAVVSRLDLEDHLARPVLVWGSEHGATAAINSWLREDRINFLVAENPIINGRDWQKRVIEYRDMTAPNILLSVVWWWMKQKSGYEIPIEDTDISEKMARLAENKSGRFVIVACGENGQPQNGYLAELTDQGGSWQIMPCGDEGLFEGNREQILNIIDELVTVNPEPDTTGSF